jgi:hypothetical protein
MKIDKARLTLRHDRSNEARPKDTTKENPLEDEIGLNEVAKESRTLVRKA